MYDWAEFRHFTYLLAVVEQKGFRAAADVLNTTQPNLSAQAKQFQANSGLRLYRRSKSGRIRLTATGIAFRQIARGLLDARGEAMAALLAVERGEVRTLRLACSTQADPNLLHTFCTLHKELLPDCPVLPAHGGDAAQLIEEVASGEVDAAIVTLPVSDPGLFVDVIRRDRLVVCLRIDSPLAAKSALQPSDLRELPLILYHPQRQPHAHANVLKLLAEIDIKVAEYSRASHPSELQLLVNQGFGFALIHEGTVLDPNLTTRPIAGVDWAVETAFIYKKQGHPKTIPVLIRHLKRRMTPSPAHQKKSPIALGEVADQMSLLA
jgi:DNA-binding transcriptional LysR family regulator